jgi:hypothetical protein
MLRVAVIPSWLAVTILIWTPPVANSSAGRPCALL